jgi:hypothetical protein
MAPIPIKNLPGLQVTTLQNTNSKLQRLGTLNDSYRKRYATYTKIAAMVVIFLVGFIIIQMVEPMVPPVVGNILMVVLVLFVGYYIATYFSELGSRSALNYDELDIPTTNPGDTQDKQANLGDTASGGSLIPDFDTCTDDSCCATGSKYSTTLHKCIPNCSSLDGSRVYYDPAHGTCHETTASGYINTAGEGFASLGSSPFNLGSEFQTSGEQYVDKARMSLPMSAVGGASTGGLTPSNEGIEKYSYV